MTLKKRQLLGSSALMACVVWLWAAAARAQDLESGVTQASSEFKRVVKVGLSVASVIIIVLGLMFSAVKFSRKDPEAVWYLVGTVAAAVLCGIASGMM